MPGEFEIKNAETGQFHFNLKPANGGVILSAVMDNAKAGAKNGIGSVRKNAAVDARFARRESKNGKPYFVLKTGNHQVIGQNEIYKTTRARNNGIRSVAKNAPGAKFIDLTV